MYAIVARRKFPSQTGKKTDGLGPLLEVAMSKKCTPLWRSTFLSQNVELTPMLDHFWKLRCPKVHTVVARSTFQKVKGRKHTNIRPLLEVEMSKKCTPIVARSIFPSQKCKKLTVSDHFWKLRCQKSAHRCSAKHISKSQR